MGVMHASGAALEHLAVACDDVIDICRVCRGDDQIVLEVIESIAHHTRQVIPKGSNGLAWCDLVARKDGVTALLERRVDSNIELYRRRPKRLLTSAKNIFLKQSLWYRKC